ncbi:ABC transporter substrate-binding protein [Microbacterium allomyrinae]|uniref:Carbohydrate ABC transporter substrate-binding protein n=1 Tax=Microbacterium allomyrinae TaxID=2830666 RepID=A0A9X1LTH6_9MICO|nr:ABC transporter substrate-binding protein [Microbacterium allomyrinae]MCC2031517.1 carbohydrate ABC transporter substrate-binding protein [Microbacterium allomyrinae]
MALAICALAATGLTACAPADDSTGPVRFWAFSGIEQVSQVEKYLDENPGVAIELAEQGTSAETADALTAALAAGAPPDLVLIQADDMPRFLASPERFTDLRSLGADANSGDYLPWAWEAGLGPAGEVIGIPTDVGGMSIAYRADLFEAADLPTDPEAVAALWPTWQDFIHVGERFTEATGIPFVDNVSTTLFANASNQLATKFYSPDGKPVHDANPDLEESFDLALQAHGAGISAGMESFSAGWSAGLARGAFAVVAAPSWMLRVITAAAPDTEGLWRIAAVPGVAGNWGGSYLAIPATSDHQTQAWDYIAQTQTPDAQLALFESGGPLPAARAPYEDDVLASFADPFFGQSRVGAVLTEALTRMPVVAQGPASTLMNTAFTQSLMAVEQGSLSAEVAWDSAIESIDLSLDR